MSTSNIGRAEMPKKGGVTVHPVVRDLDGIVYLANQGTISFHATTTNLSPMAHPSTPRSASSAAGRL